MNVSATATSSTSNILRQHIVVRRDLLVLPDWTVGALAAQACHAATAMMWKYREHPNMIRYASHCENTNAGLVKDVIDPHTDGEVQMTKLLWEVPNEHELISIAKRLEDEDKIYYLWCEGEEKQPTAIAILPYSKDDFSLKLLGKKRTMFGNTNVMPSP